MHGALGVADTPLQDALFDDDSVVGQDPLVVEEVGARVLLHGGAVVHGDQGRGHILAHEPFGLGPILHEHIHLHPMAEGLVDDHARDGGGAHALIFPRHHAFAVDELQSALHRVVQLPPERVQHLGAAQDGGAVVIADDVVPLGAHDVKGAVAPQQILLQIPVGGEKELVYLLELEPDGAVDDPLVPAPGVVPNGGEGGQYGLVPLLVRVDGILRALEEHRGFVGYPVVFADGQASRQPSPKGHEPLRHLCLNGGDGRLVQMGEGILPVGSAVVDLEHEAPAGEQLVLPHVDAGVPHPVRLAPGVGRQHGRIAVLLRQPPDQLLQQGLGIPQKRAALYLHSCTSCVVFFNHTSLSKQFQQNGEVAVLCP